ncbi:MAG: Subunit of type restriction-modification system [Gemmataceae bacterium]|nr:Subunit of type restriction-modification system [Gemmataceae bacterium]
MFFRINTRSFATRHPVMEPTRQTAFARCVRPVRRTGMGREGGIGTDPATRPIVGSKCYLNASCSAARWPSSMDLDQQQFLRRLGDRIRDRRTTLNLTQAEFAKMCGLHRTFIGSVERGERNLALLSLRRIATALRVTPAELLTEPDPPPK